MLAILVVLLAAGVMQAAQSAAPPQQQQAAQQPPASQQANTAPQQEAESLHLLAGRSLVITSPARIRRVSVADPTVIEAVAVTPNAQ